MGVTRVMVWPDLSSSSQLALTEHLNAVCGNAQRQTITCRVYRPLVAAPAAPNAAAAVVPGGIGSATTPVGQALLQTLRPLVSVSASRFGGQVTVTDGARLVLLGQSELEAMVTRLRSTFVLRGTVSIEQSEYVLGDAVVRYGVVVQQAMGQGTTAQRRGIALEFECLACHVEQDGQAYLDAFVPTILPSSVPAPPPPGPQGEEYLAQIGPGLQPEARAAMRIVAALAGNKLLA